MRQSDPADDRREEDLYTEWAAHPGAREAFWNKQIRRFIETVPSGVLLLAAGRIVEVNGRVATLFGCPSAQIVSRELREFVAAETHSALERWLRGECGETVLVSGRHRNGAVFPMELRTLAGIAYNGQRVNLAMFSQNA